MAIVLPYYPMYPVDFDEDEHVLPMTLAETGLYFSCLNEAWKRGSIPDDPKAIAIRIRRDHKDVKKAWERVKHRWVPNGEPGRLVNPRQEEEREKAICKSEQASSAASQRKAQNVPGFVYFISRLSDGAVKIGSSLNVAKRLAQLRYKYRPDALDLIGSIPSQEMGILELSLHAKFAKHKLHGEWYGITPEQVAITLGGDMQGDKNGDSEPGCEGDTNDHPMGVHEHRAFESISSLEPPEFVTSNKERYSTRPATSSSSHAFREFVDLWGKPCECCGMTFAIQQVDLAAQIWLRLEAEGKLSDEVITAIMEGLRRHRASKSWHDGYVIAIPGFLGWSKNGVLGAPRWNDRPAPFVPEIERALPKTANQIRHDRATQEFLARPR